MWYYACKSTKYITILVTVPNVVLLWPWYFDYQIHFRLVCLSIPSVPMISFKDQLMGNDTIHLEFLLTVEVVCWSKLSGVQSLKDKKNSPLTINNYLLKHIGVTILNPIYLWKEIAALLFKQHGVPLAVIEAQETEKELVIWTETCSSLLRILHPLSLPPKGSGDLN